MAKAKYRKSQRVFLKPVGTWAYVEAVVPTWVEGCEEPIKISYDCGMGREFAQGARGRVRRAPGQRREWPRHLAHPARA